MVLLRIMIFFLIPYVYSVHSGPFLKEPILFYSNVCVCVWGVGERERKRLVFKCFLLSVSFLKVVFHFSTTILFYIVLLYTTILFYIKTAIVALI